MLCCSRDRVLKVQMGAYKQYRHCRTSRSPTPSYVGGFLFYSPRWAPFTYIWRCVLDLSGSPLSSSVVEAHSVSREWDGLSPVGFLGQRVIQVLSHPGSVGISWSLGWSLGDHLRSYPPVPTLLICRATSRPPHVAPACRTARPVRGALPRLGRAVWSRSLA